MKSSDPVIFGSRGRGSEPPEGRTAAALSAKRTIEMFEFAGCTSHSAAALTLGIVVNYCERNAIAYTLHASPGQGYYIRKGSMLGAKT